MKKYFFPKCLENLCQPDKFEKWLERKARTHVKRDRKKGLTATREIYKAAMHNAVIQSAGLDAYTGKKLSWDLISKYDNDTAKKKGRKIKKEFGNLPTIDHCYDNKNALTFKVCSWRINDSKNDLSINEFISLCEEVLGHHKRKNKK